MVKPAMGPARGDMGRTFVWATALFAIMCGVLLMLFGGSGGAIAEESDQESVKSVIAEIDAAANALEDQDYGRTKAYLRSARMRLTRLDQ